MTYTVRDVVCDYGVYEIYFDKDGEQHENLKLICNSRSNALLIAEIMRADLKNKKFDWIWMKKIEDIKAEIQNGMEMFPDGDFYIGVDVLEKIIDKHISGEPQESEENNNEDNKN